MTAKTIQGSAPYLTFDGGKTKAIDTTTLLTMTLSDGSVYTGLNNSSSSSNPITLPVEGQTLDDISLFIPKGKTAITLNELIDEPYHYWGDDDGDGQGVNGIRATGSLSLKMTDVNNTSVSRQDVLSGCNAPYKVVLSAVAGKLTTQYGDPNLTNFKASSATYYITPKIEKPYTCFAKPNLVIAANGQPEWDSYNGFKVQSLDEPKKNFPRTGFHNAFFDITIAGGNARSVIDTMGKEVSPIFGSGVTLTLSNPSNMGGNVLRVTLKGANSSTKGGSFQASTFSLKIGATEIYNFEISKWFIAQKNGRNYTNTRLYCSSLAGKYRLASVGEYTNANGFGWTYGLPKQGNKYARAIGNGRQKTAIAADDRVGGLFAEWGSVGEGYYIGSDFEKTPYWTSDSNSSYIYTAGSETGYVGANNPPSMSYGAACVTP